jgi:hypothetical protein
VATGTSFGAGDESDPLLPGAPEMAYYLGLESSCPPEYVGVPLSEVIADAAGQQTGVAVNEVLAAGFQPRAAPAASRSGSGFESGGMLDVCAPSGSLAGLADAATRDGRLADLDDDELIGVIRAWDRLESWCSAGTLAAIAELARRRPAEQTAPARPRTAPGPGRSAPTASAGSFPDRLSEFISDEVAAALTLTGRAADARLELSLDLATRLPATARALHEGIISYPKAQLIADLTRVLSGDDARAVEARILPTAGQQTTGQLRAAVSRAVLAADPEAAARRREEAQRDPRVRRWREDAGTAALAGYGLPPTDVLQADQRITDHALHLRDAGLPGSLEELRARAYLDALLGQDSAPPANPDHSARPNQPADPAQPASRAQPAAADVARPQPNSQAAPSAAAWRPDSSPNPRRRLAARVNLTVPLLTQLGLAAEPGNVGGFGPVDPALARTLAASAAADPASRFCVTVTGRDGRAIGHGCMPGRPPDLSRPDSPGFTVTISPLAGDVCDHRHEEAAYQPSRKLRHLIWARSTTCCAPGCRRPAAQCDLDHTTPYDQGGRTCECGLAPLCRHHHRCKQSEGWRLEQPSPGTMRWITPAGRRYLTMPDAVSDP